MKRFLASFMVLIPVSFWSIAYSEQKPDSQTDAPYFTNKDLERYNNPSDSKIEAMKTNITGTKEEKGKAKAELKEREDWCKKATYYKRKIERGHDEVSEIEKELSADTLSRKKKAALEKKLAVSQKRVAYLEKDMADLEEEAHRKNIPPGWLRCQFE